MAMEKKRDMKQKEILLQLCLIYLQQSTVEFFSAVMTAAIAPNINLCEFGRKGLHIASQKTIQKLMIFFTLFGRVTTLFGRAITPFHFFLYVFTCGPLDHKIHTTFCHSAGKLKYWDFFK